MSAPADAGTRRVDRFLSAAALALAGVAAATGGLALVGWWSSTPELTRPFVGSTRMAANVALAVLLLAASLALLAGADRRRHQIGRVLAAVAAVVALLSLIERAFGVSLGIDRLLVRDALSAGDASRMSVLTATLLLSAALALLVVGHPSFTPRRRALWVVVPAAVTVVPLLGYAYGAYVLSAPSRRISMAFGTTVAVAAIGIGAVCLATPPRVRRLLARDDCPGARTRMLLAAGPLVVVGLGLLATRVVTEQDADTAVAQAVASLLLLVGAAFAVGAVAARLESESAARREAEAERDLARRQMAAILDGAPAIVYLRGQDGHFLLANRTFHEVLDVTTEALGDVRDEDVFGDDGARLRQADLAVLASGTSEESRERLQLPRVGERWFHAVRFRVVTDPRGTTATCVIATDVSDHALLERRITESERLEAIGTLAGGVAHDFNNLITVINGAAELGLMQTEDEQLRRDLGAILDAGRRGASLARQLLAFSRRNPAEPQLLDVGRVVQELSGLMRHGTDDEVELTVRVDDGVPRAVVDRGALEQSLMHLLANARAAVPAGGKIRVEVAFVRIPAGSAAARSGTKPGSYVRLSVADTGVGMTREVQARAFEPFFTTRSGERTGLGLSSVYGTVAQAGGHVELNSELGMGTVVRLYLPAHAADAADAIPVDVHPGEHRSQGRLLVVEDDPAVRSVTVRVLRSAGFDLVEADDADDALAAMRGKGSHFDVLVTDLVMPDMSGVALAERARTLLPDLAVVVMSGYTPALIEPELGDRLRHGVVALEKPFTREQLLAAVDDALARHPRLTDG